MLTDKKSMFYVATLIRYVLVEAESEAQAREVAMRRQERYSDLRARQIAQMPVEILKVRPATPDEVEFWPWGEEVSPRRLSRRS